MIVSVINYKGGVGKTTVTANLGAALAAQGRKVLLIDLDPQTNLTFSFVRVEDWRQNLQNATIKQWFDAFIDNNESLPLQRMIHTPAKVNEQLEKLPTGGHLSLIPSHLGLINVDHELGPKLWGKIERDQRRNFLIVHSRLKQGLQQLEGYDDIIIDCPPNFNVVTKTAVVASEMILVPAKPDFLSTIGIKQLKRHIVSLRADYNQKLEGLDTHQSRFEPESSKIFRIVFTMVGKRLNQPYSIQKKYIKEVQRESVDTFTTTIRDNKTIHADAPESGIPIVLQRQNQKSYKEVQQEFLDLAEEYIHITTNN